MTETLDRLAAEWGQYSSQLAANRRVLVVEDDPTAGHVFAKVLEHGGFVCTVVKNGEEALASHQGGDFACLIVDKNLPGMSGMELVRTWQTSHRESEAVLITGYANLDAVLQAIDLRAADFLLKPLDSIDVLTAAVDKGIRRRNRRLLARRMLGDLSRAVEGHANDRTLELLTAAHARVEDFRGALVNKRRVLVSHRESVELATAMKHLFGAGYQLIVVKTAAEALHRISKRGVNVFVVSDTYEGLGGLALVERALDSEGRPELVFLTAHATVREALVAVERGASSFLVKPLKDDRVLVKAVEEACRAHHERLVHFKLVTELTALVRLLESKPERRQTRETLRETLESFDVRTAPDLVKPFDGTPGEWDDTD